jgi:hypothetical protein
MADVEVQRLHIFLLRILITTNLSARVVGTFSARLICSAIVQTLRERLAHLPISDRQPACEVCTLWTSRRSHAMEYCRTRILRDTLVVPQPR